ISQRVDARIRSGRGAGRKSGNGRQRVAAVPALPIAEDALSRGVGQYRVRDQRARVADVLVVQGEEEGLVAHDRTAVTRRELVCVSPIQRGGLPGAGERIGRSIIAPGVGVECGISNVPYRASRITVGPRTRLDLDLAVAATDFRVDRRQDDAD